MSYRVVLHCVVSCHVVSCHAYVPAQAPNNVLHLNDVQDEKQYANTTHIHVLKLTNNQSKARHIIQKIPWLNMRLLNTNALRTL